MIGATIDTKTIQERQKFRYDFGVGLRALRDREIGRFARYTSSSSIQHTLEECAKHNFFIPPVIDKLLPVSHVRDIHKAALHFSQYENYDAVEYLHERANLCADNQMIPLCDAIILKAVRSGNDSVVLSLLECRNNPQHLTRSILLNAARSNETGILKAMVDAQNCLSADIIGDHYTSPLMEAISGGFLRMVSYILDQCSSFEYYNYRFIKKAFLFGNLQMKHLFLTKWDVPIEDRIDAELNRAVQHRELRNIISLLNVGANPTRDHLLNDCFFNKEKSCPFEIALVLANSTNGHLFYNHFTDAIDTCPPIWPLEYLENSRFKYLFDAMTWMMKKNRVECLLRVFFRKLSPNAYQNIKSTVTPLFRLETKFANLIKFWDALYTNDVREVLKYINRYSISFQVNGRYPVDRALEMGFLKIASILLRQNAPCHKEDESRVVKDEYLHFFAKLGRMDETERRQLEWNSTNLHPVERPVLKRYLEVWENLSN